MWGVGSGEWGGFVFYSPLPYSLLTLERFGAEQRVQESIVFLSPNRPQ